MKTIQAEARTSGSRDAVWTLLADAGAWTRWGAWTENEVEGGGPQQVGAVRRMAARGYRIRERITEMEPGRRFGYALVEGMNVQGYAATVTLEDAPGGGTVVRWRSTYERAGPFTAVILRLAIRDACRRVAKAASA